MSYRVVIQPRLRRILPTIGLSDAALVEVHLRLIDDLRDDPWLLLHREPDPAGAMSYFFQFIDPENRLLVHAFLFSVVYGQDEETLLVPYGLHAKISVL